MRQLKAKPDMQGITTISETMTRMRILVGRRVVSRMAVQKMDTVLDLGDTDVLKAVKWIAEEDEVTVGAIAEMMRIDPSRGSRLVSDLVRKGMLRRAVSQKDARRTVVELTDQATAYFEKADQAKREIVQEITKDWSEDDIARFGEMFARFVAEFENIAKTNGV